MAYLTLEDGTMYEGEAFGAMNDSIGEVVFNTGMTGYQEAFTDPSYYGQIIMMTYPLIGNYGVNWEDPESTKPQVKGIVAREICEVPSNWHSEGSLNDYLRRHHIMGIQGIDTRALTRKLRSEGTMRGIITQRPPTPEQMEQVRRYHIENPAASVTTPEKFEIPGSGLRIAVMDYGVKASILSSLRRRKCHLTVYPSWTPPEEILKEKFDGLMLSPGPGDPADNVVESENLKGLVGKLPIFGICMGHSLMAMALGGRTKKLKYGHHGSNHPVKDLRKDRVYITSQNHGYAVDDEHLPQGAVVSHRSWNDQTVEGLIYPEFKAFTVQYHPEASPGPKDTGYLFDEFLDMIRENQ